MYEARYRVSIVGVSPLLQHKFPDTVLNGLMNGVRKRSGENDYSLEWLDTLYAHADGYLVQPASHIEGAMVKAATQFKIKGARGKTWKDATRGFISVAPELIPHLHNGECIPVPDESLMEVANDLMSVSVMRVVVQRSAVARARLQIETGWNLQFDIHCIEEQMSGEVIRTILEHAGHSVGIGDFRPKYGRFEVDAFNSL